MTIIFYKNSIHRIKHVSYRWHRLEITHRNYSSYLLNKIEITYLQRYFKIDFFSRSTFISFHSSRDPFIKA